MILKRDVNTQQQEALKEQTAREAGGRLFPFTADRFFCEHHSMI